MLLETAKIKDRSVVNILDCLWPTNVIPHHGVLSGIAVSEIVVNCWKMTQEADSL